LFRAVALEHLHVAGVGRRAIEDLRREDDPSHDLAERRVLEVREPGPALALRQEEVPEPGRLGLGLERLHAGRRHPAVRGLLDVPVVVALDRVDVLLHEGEEALAEIAGARARLGDHGVFSFSRSRAARVRSARARTSAWSWAKSKATGAMAGRAPAFASS